MRKALEEKGAGRVLVVDTGGSMRCAVLGDNLAESAQRNGWSVSVHAGHAWTFQAAPDGRGWGPAAAAARLRAELGTGRARCLRVACLGLPAGSLVGAQGTRGTRGTCGGWWLPPHQWPARL